MISMENLNHTWSAIMPVKGQTVARRADAGHPLDFFIGFSEEEKMQLMLITDNEMQLPDSSQQVKVRANKRTDGKYAVCFILINPSLSDTFISLCWDIMACTNNADDKNAGNEAAVRRFGVWMIMLAKGNDGGMSENSAKGLLGELVTLEKICIPKYGFSKALTGWLGPLHADRDFEYEDNWYESKAMSSGSEIVRISSFDQLDIDKIGDLVICRLDKTNDEDPSGISLEKTVDKLRELAEGDEAALSTLQVRLMLAGYKLDDSQIDTAYLFRGFENYAVGDGFPRIRKSELPNGVVNGAYSLDLSVLSSWREQ